MIEIHKSAKILLNSHLILNDNKLPWSRAECYLRLRENAELTIKGTVTIYYNSTLEVHYNGKLTLGGMLVNSGAVIICAYKMSIGKGCLIARQCMISDSDHHRTLDGNSNITNYPREVVIGDNVWLGTRVTIMKGTKMKDGSVAGSDSLVMGRVKENTLVMNEPAREFSKINWSPEGFNND